MADWDPRCDFDGNGQVTVVDYTWFGTFYGKPIDKTNPKNVQADFNRDGVVDDADKQYLLDRYLMMKPEGWTDTSVASMRGFPTKIVLYGGIGILILWLLRKPKFGKGNRRK